MRQHCGQVLSGRTKKHMNSKQVEKFDRYIASNDCIDTHHSFVSRRAVLPESYYPVLDLIPRRIEELKIENPLVLDLAMGSGQTSAYLEKMKLRVIRAELSWSALNINKGFRVRCSADDELPFGNESLDAVHFKDALIHIEDKSKLFGEIRRVLKTRGVLLMTSAKNPTEPFFYYYRKYKGRQLKEEKSFSTLTEYCHIVSQMEKSNKISGIYPPYFVVDKGDIDNGLREHNLKVIKYFIWKRRPLEPDWYDEREPRMVYLVRKE